MTWHCTRDQITEPCGDCDGCRYAATLCRVERVTMREVAFGPRFSPACGLPVAVEFSNGDRTCAAHAQAVYEVSLTVNDAYTGGPP